MSIIVTPSEQSRSAAMKIVSRQIERLKDTPRSRRFQDDVFEEIRRQRQAKGQYRIEALPLGTTERLEFGQDFMVVVGGEVLVVDDDADAATPILSAASFKRQATMTDTTSGDPVPRCVQLLRDRVVRFTKSGASVSEAVTVVRRLLAENIQASVNYVLPLGYVAKGEGGFEPTKVKTVEGPGANQGSGARVAVIDTGIAENGPGNGWLENIPRPPGSVDELYRVRPDLDLAAGHGQFVAGIIQQVAPTAQIRVYKAIGSDGIGSDAQVAEAILVAAHDGAQLINLSLGTPARGDERPVATQVALQILEQQHRDVVVVASAGNTATLKPFYPAGFPRVQAVASLRADLKPSEWSSRGPNVAFSAVGEGICSTFVEGRESQIVDPAPETDTFIHPSWAIGTGTSFAAPQITGEIVNRMAGPPARTAWQACEDLKADGKPHSNYGARLKILPGTPR